MTIPLHAERHSCDSTTLKPSRCAIVYSLSIMLGCFLVIENIAGDYVVRPDIFTIGQYGPHFQTEAVYQHGFPFTYLWRSTPEQLTVGSVSAVWSVRKHVTRFEPLHLAANLIIGLIVVWLTFFLCTKLLKSKKCLLQISAMELLLIVGVLASCAGVYSHARTIHLHELSIVQKIGASDARDIVWKRRGPSWLRQIVGDTLFRAFDRVVAVRIEGNQLEHATALREVKVVWINDYVSDSQLRALTELPHLEALDLSFVILVEEAEVVDEHGVVLEQYLTLPQMPKLRGLNLHGTAFRGDGLAKLRSIEVLDLTDTDIDDESIDALLSLSNLKRLLISETDVSDGAVKRLRVLCQSCEIER